MGALALDFLPPEELEFWLGSTITDEDRSLFSESQACECGENGWVAPVLWISGGPMSDGPASYIHCPYPIAILQAEDTEVLT